MKKLAIISLVLLAVMLGIPAGLQLFAQERSARGFVEGMLESMLATEGRTVAIDGVSISLTGNVSARRVEIRDGTDNWLVMEGLALDWQPLSLFGKNLVINSLSFDTIEMLRLPQSEDSGVTAPQEVAGLTNAEINRLHVGTLKIASAVTGEDVELTIEGSGQIKESPPEIKIDFVADRTDGKEGRLKAGIVLDPRSRQISVDIAVNEQSNGIISGLLNLRGDPAVDLSVEAQGTFDDWTGTFVLDLDKERVLAGKAAEREQWLDAPPDGRWRRRCRAAGARRSRQPVQRKFATHRLDSDRQGRRPRRHSACPPRQRRFPAFAQRSGRFVGRRQQSRRFHCAPRMRANLSLVTGPEALGQVGIAELKLDGTLSGALSAPTWDIALKRRLGDIGTSAAQRVSISGLQVRLVAAG